MMVSEELKKIISKAANVPLEQVKLEIPESEDFGDYSSNIALIMKGGRQKAEEISVKIEKGTLIERIEIAGPGFMNFFLNKGHLLGQLLEGKVFEIDNKALKQKKIVVEYTDPNPFKELHIGHLYSNVIGESVARILEANGAVVWRADFYGDVGLHVAKSVWGMRKKLEEDKTTILEIAKLGVRERQKFLGQAYATGTIQYDQNSDAKTEIDHLNTLIYSIAQNLLKEEKGWKLIVDYKNFVNATEFEYEEIKEIYRLGLKWSLEYFESLYSILGTKFDGYYPESLVGEYGYQLVMEGLSQGVFEKSDGAIIFRGENIGQHTRVFINKNNLPTYEAKDMGVALAKYNDFPYDMDINVTGNEIKEYFKVVIPALTAVKPELGKATKALSHGMVNLPEGKMSSRSGNVITIEMLLNEATEHAKQLIDSSDNKSNDKKFDETEIEHISRSVGMAAVRYAFLKSNIGNDISFSFKDSVTFEGNSGPYLQYTLARMNSVISKSNNDETNSDIDFGKYKLNIEEERVMKCLVQYPEVLAEAGEKLAPHLMCNYLYDLASKFNSFYNKHSILSPDGDAEVVSRHFRLLLTRSSAQMLKNGLVLLGITPLERM